MQQNSTQIDFSIKQPLWQFNNTEKNMNCYFGNYFTIKLKPLAEAKQRVIPKQKY